MSISPKRVPDGERIPSAAFYTPFLPPKPRTEPRDHCPASSHTVCRRPQRCPINSTTQMHCACSQYHIRHYGTEAERSCGLSLRRPSASSGGHHMQLQHTYLSNLLAFPRHRVRLPEHVDAVLYVLDRSYRHANCTVERKSLIPLPSRGAAIGHEAAVAQGGLTYAAGGKVRECSN